MSDMISCQLKLEYQLNSHIICYALNLDESHKAKETPTPSLSFSMRESLLVHGIAHLAHTG